VDSALGDYNAAHMNYKQALEIKWHVYGENAKNTTWPAQTEDAFPLLSSFPPMEQSSNE
jgi:hypothetical protein